MPIRTCDFSQGIGDDRLCVEGSTSRCRVVVAHGCVFRMSAKPASSEERIARLWERQGRGAKRISPPACRRIEERPPSSARPAADRRVPSAADSHASPCPTEPRSSSSLESRALSGCPQLLSTQIGSAHVAPPLALNMLTCCGLNQQNDSVAHPIMRDKRPTEEENLTPC